MMGNDGTRTLGFISSWILEKHFRFVSSSPWLLNVRVMPYSPPSQLIQQNWFPFTTHVLLFTMCVGPEGLLRYNILILTHFPCISVDSTKSMNRFIHYDFMISVCTIRSVFKVRCTLCDLFVSITHSRTCQTRYLLAESLIFMFDKYASCRSRSSSEVPPRTLHVLLSRVSDCPLLSYDMKSYGIIITRPACRWKFKRRVLDSTLRGKEGLDESLRFWLTKSWHQNRRLGGTTHHRNQFKLEGRREGSFDEGLWRRHRKASRSPSDDRWQRVWCFYWVVWF